MKARLMVLASSFVLTGCPLTPVLNETTPPNLYFTVWYENASHNSNSDEMGPVAAFSLDAVLRTLGRLWITRRRLLEWQASADLAPRAAPTRTRRSARSRFAALSGPAFI